MVWNASCPPPNPIKLCSLSSSFREWGRQDWLGSSETRGPVQEPKPTLKWTCWTLKPKKESFRSWNIGDRPFYVFWKLSSLIHVELQCCWHKILTLKKKKKIKLTQLCLRMYKQASLVAQNLPAKVGNRFNPWSGKMPHAVLPCVTTIEPVLQSPRATTTETLEPVLHKRSPCNEKPMYCNWRVAPAPHN